jgi:hypothetical protein
MDAPRKTYAATVAGNALALSKNSQTPSIKICVQTEHEVSDPSTPIRKKLYGDLWLTFAAYDRTVKTLQEAFRFMGAPEDLNEPLLVGKRVNVVCEEEEYNGEVRDKIVFFNRPSALSSLEGNNLSAVLDQLAKIRKAKGMEPQFGVADLRPAVAPAAAGPIVDDLPF